MGDTETIIFRMDAALKRRCEAIYEELGFSLEEAAVLFFEKSAEAKGFPEGVRPEYLQDDPPRKTKKQRKGRKTGRSKPKPGADEDIDDKELIDAFWDMKESMY